MVESWGTGARGSEAAEAAAVDAQGGAGDEAGVVGGEEGNRGGDIFGPAEYSQAKADEAGSQAA